MRKSVLVLWLLVAILIPMLSTADDAADRPSLVNDPVVSHIEARRSRFGEIAQQIWDLAEVGYQEVESSELLQATLSEADFEIEAGVAGMPTAFIAEFGAGEPVIAVLAEFDALPGLSQTRAPTRTIREGAGAGHACGHHLFGTASVAAAVAVADWLRTNEVVGTLRVYGTPAEEGGAGKAYLVRDGFFDDVDVALHWHPADVNNAGLGSMLANKSAKFRFFGVSAHAAAAPHRARSALDGVEAMNHMVNLLREHVPQETRIHYVITEGGRAPNVTPDFAEVYYYVRHPDSATLHTLFDRVVAASEGAARGTGTRVEHEVMHGVNALIPNETLARIVDAQLRQVGGVDYDLEDVRFARALRASFGDDAPPMDRALEIVPFADRGLQPGSTDVGDVSQVVPTAGVSTATWVPGTAPHSWQAIASGGSAIGNKGMINAAKTLALTARELFAHTDHVAAARAEYLRRVGPDFEYRSLVGDRRPPLDYRSTSKGR